MTTLKDGRSAKRDPAAAAAALVEIFETRAASGDGRIRVEDLLSAASAACGEACIAAAAEFDPEHHSFTPGAVVLSDRINGLLAGDSADVAAAPDNVFGLIHAGAVAHGYAESEFPSLEEVFRGFAAGVASTDPKAWGFVPLSVSADHRPRTQPLRDAYELRPLVRGVFSRHAIETRDWPGVCALALVSELARVAGAIEHAVALRLVFETVNGMAKTAPMTDEQMAAATATA